jgi:Zn-dependent metalloprotease
MIRRKEFLVLLTLGLFAAAAPAHQQRPGQSARQSGTAEKMKSVPQIQSRAADEKPQLTAPVPGVIPNAVVQKDATTGQVRHVEGQVSVPGASSARDAATKFLETNARTLGLSQLLASKDPDTGLRIVQEQKSLTGTHFTYQQFYGNLPVFDEQLKVKVDNNLKVTTLTHDIEPVPPGRGVEQPLSREEAITAAVAAVQSKSGPSNPPTAEAGILMSKAAGPTAVWRVKFKTRSPGADWEVMVDGATKQVLSVRNRAQYADGKGMIFNPNPVVSSGSLDFKDNNNADFTPSTRELISVTLRELDGTGLLQGTYVSTASTTGFKRAKEPSLVFNFKRSDPRFEEIMAYYWVTEGILYIHSLGFTNILNRQIGIDVNGTDDDQSWYSPSSGELTFGAGGVDDAEDADIIMHELGHAILDSQVKDFGPDPQTEARAISEAFGDYWAASFFAGRGPKKEVWDVYVGEWDASEYNPGEPAYLRRVDGNKRYPQGLDKDMEPHNNGEMWSACLWQVWKLVGKKRADIMILESQFALDTEATFTQAANAILDANQSLSKGRDQAALRKVFTDRGIL